MLRNWLKEQEGQDLSEYALLLVLITVALIIGITALREEIIQIFGDTTAALGAR
jgi:Flp pilus assembly pilin Flp